MSITLDQLPQYDADTDAVGCLECHDSGWIPNPYAVDPCRPFVPCNCPAGQVGIDLIAFEAEMRRVTQVPTEARNQFIPDAAEPPF